MNNKLTNKETQERIQELKDMIGYNSLENQLNRKKESDYTSLILLLLGLLAGYFITPGFAIIGIILAGIYAAQKESN